MNKFRRPSIFQGGSVLQTFPLRSGERHQLAIAKLVGFVFLTYTFQPRFEPAQP